MAHKIGPTKHTKEPKRTTKDTQAEPQYFLMNVIKLKISLSRRRFLKKNSKNFLKWKIHLKRF